MHKLGDEGVGQVEERVYWRKGTLPDPHFRGGK